jgi:L-amino acid N-acyltransferase YncA
LAGGEKPVTSKPNTARRAAIHSLLDCDEAALARFVAKVPPHDLLFVDRDIRVPKVLTAWRQAIERGAVHSLVATVDGEVVATTAIVRDPLSWSAHVAELRMMVLPDWRGRGTGRTLLQASIERAVADGATKLTARMTSDQRGAITLFEEAGFRAEALLADHVRAPDGELHDIAILSLDVAKADARRRALSD